jgi:hypothetical protein
MAETCGPLAVRKAASSRKYSCNLIFILQGQQQLRSAREKCADADAAHNQVTVLAPPRAKSESSRMIATAMNAPMNA